MKSAKTLPEQRSAARLKLWLALGWLQTLGVTILSLLPLRELPGPAFSHLDKLYHVTAYGVLMAWFAWATPVARRKRLAGWLLVLGIAIELAQGYVPYRASSVADVLADALGIALAAWLVRHPYAGFAAVAGSK